MDKDQALNILRNGIDGRGNDGPEYTEAASVLSAEIERLTRRVGELTHERDEWIARHAGMSTAADKFFAQFTNAYADKYKAEAALASAAAPDERVLAEREACAQIVDAAAVEVSQFHVSNFALVGAASVIRSRPSPIRTPPHE